MTLLTEDYTVNFTAFMPPFLLIDNFLSYAKMFITANQNNSHVIYQRFRIKNTSNAV